MRTEDFLIAVVTVLYSSHSINLLNYGLLFSCSKVANLE